MKKRRNKQIAENASLFHIRLRMLGYRDYRAYLASDHWKQVRAAYRAAHPWECVVCGSTKELNLHHRDYEYLGAEQTALHRMALLCRRHHSAVHFRSSRRNETIARSTSTVLNRRKRPAKPKPKVESSGGVSVEAIHALLDKRS